MKFDHAFFRFDMAASLNTLIELCEHESIEQLGWTELPRVDGRSCKTWDDVMAAVHNSGLDVLDAVWINRPLVISNQSLFKIEDSILGEVRQLKSRGELNRFFDAHKLEGRSRETQKILSSMFPRSIASSLDMTEISSYEVPQHVRRAHSSAIIGVGRWYTDGDVEEGGDVSVS